MKVTDQLIAGIHQPSRALSHEEIKDLAKDTLFHPCSCQCQGCQTFAKAVANAPAAPVRPASVSETLASSFKSLVSESDGRGRPKGHTVTVHDEAGRGKLKKSKKTSEKLLASLGAVLKH